MLCLNGGSRPGNLAFCWSVAGLDWAAELFGRIGLSGKGRRVSLSGSVLQIWMGSYSPVCHLILQDRWSGGWGHVGVIQCLHWFKPNNTPIWDSFPV